MPTWLKTAQDERAWATAKRIVADERQIAESAFTPREFALCTHIAKGILRSQKKRHRSAAMATVDASLPVSDQQLLEALQGVANAASRSIALIRAGNPIDTTDLAREFEAAAKKIVGKA